MNIPRDEALLLARSWMDSAVVIALVSEVGNLRLRLSGQVVKVRPEVMILDLGDAGTIEIDLTDCEFQYGDHRAAPEVVAHSSQGHPYEHFLVIQYPEKEMTMLFEAKKWATQ